MKDKTQHNYTIGIQSSSGSNNTASTNPLTATLIFNNIQVNTQEGFQSDSSENTLTLARQRAIQILQQIDDICAARIECNQELSEYIKPFTTKQELEESNILSQNAKKQLKYGKHNVYVMKEALLIGTSSDSEKYTNIKKKITGIKILIANVVKETDISIYANQTTIKYNLNLIEIYHSLIMPFWASEKNTIEYSSSNVHKDFREYYYVNLIKEQWEQLLPISYKTFAQKYFPFIEEQYKYKMDALTKSNHTLNNITNKIHFKQNQLDNFKTLALNELEQIAKEIMAIEETNPEMHRELLTNFTTTRTESHQFYIQHINSSIEEDKKKHGDNHLSMGTHYLLYIYLKTLLELSSKIKSKLSSKKQELPTHLITALQQLKIEEKARRKELYEEENLEIANQDLLMQQQESILINQTVKIENQVYTEAIRRNTIEQKEQQSRENIRISFQMYLQKQENLAKQPKSQNNTKKEAIPTTDHKSKLILDTRIFTIEQEIVLANFKMLTTLMDNTNNLTFSEATHIINALGGRIESNNSGGSHHKILFQNRITGCFDTIGTVVKPHGKDKENNITGFTLRIFKRMVERSLQKNWRTLQGTDELKI